MKINLEKYQKQNTEKLDAVGTGVSIEKKHKDFIEKFHINLSALVRDVLGKLMLEKNVKGDSENE